MPNRVSTIVIGWTEMGNELSFRKDPEGYFPRGFSNLLAHGVDGVSRVVVNDGPKTNITKHPEANWDRVVPSLERFLKDNFGEQTVIVHENH